MFRIVIWMLLPLAVFTGRLVAAERVALVIGNGRYAHLAPLANPSRDAAAVGETLKRLGFEVLKADDVTTEKFFESIENFKTRAKGAKLGLVYFAGHGIEIDGKNYLLPVEAELASPAQLRTQAVPLETLLADLNQTGLPAKIAILDCCRNDPVSRAWLASRSAGGRGLAEVGDAQLPAATMVMFSAGPGQVALDGTGLNSPFTEALVKRLAAPGQNLFEAFLGTSDDVMKLTENRQEPWVKFDGAGRVFRNLLIAPPAGTPPPAVDFEASLESARNKLKATYQALWEFDRDYGSFPGDGTFKDVWEATESPLLTKGTTSNAYFSQLLAAGFTVDFESRPGLVPVPDARPEKSAAGFGYVIGISEASDRAAPLVLSPMMPGELKFDARPFGGKALVLRLDGTIQVHPVTAEGGVVIDGRNIFDPAQPFWKGRKPAVALPK